MGSLAKLFSPTCFLKLLPELPRLVVLLIYIMLKHCQYSSSRYKYCSIINKKSSKFRFGNRGRLPNMCRRCSICLSEIGGVDECREVVECRHLFHSHCLEEWLQRYGGTCPLCRSLIIPESIVKEHRRMQMEHQNDGMIYEELALIFSKALHGRKS